MTLVPPLQLVPAPVTFSANTLTAKAVPIGQPTPSESGPRFIPAKVGKTTLQILPNPPVFSKPPRKSIVLKNPGASASRFVTISPDNVKPFTGKIVGKVQPGVLRFSKPGVTPNQVYFTKFAGGMKAQENKVSGQLEVQAEERTVEVEEINEDRQNLHEQSVSRKLELDDEPEDGADVSLECNEEFDDSFEKKEADTDDTEDEPGEEKKEIKEEEPVMEEEQEPSDDEGSEEEGKEEVEDQYTGGVEAVDLLQPLPDTVPLDSSVRLRTNEFGIIEVEEPSLLKMGLQVRAGVNNKISDMSLCTLKKEI